MYWGNYMYFNNILQKISSKKSLLWKNENDQKNDYSPWVFVIIGSLDCDRTPKMLLIVEISFLYYP